MPGAYELQMGRSIGSVLSVFTGRVPDALSHDQVSKLIGSPQYWSAGHAVFDEVRNRLLACQNAWRDRSAHAAQYSFEEACCQAAYNATDPTDPFDASAPFFVIPAGIALAESLGLSAEHIATALRGSKT